MELFPDLHLALGNQLNASGSFQNVCVISRLFEHYVNEVNFCCSSTYLPHNSGTKLGLLCTEQES